MPIWLWLVDSLALIVVLAALLVLALVVRRRLVARRGGTFDLSINRRDEATSKGWTLGVGAFRGNTLEWYRTFSFAWWPRYRFVRGDIAIDGRRDPLGPEVYSVHTGHVIVTVRHPSGVRQMAMSPSALTGLLAWLHSSPPGHSVNNVL
ncbi:DUF2550 domain-containing protein [Aeromicrobium sp.]|uniref:DUF2550 domain-containing protein n=1 Tax=Aeromicrobium sp. TaxID=1871063 RepID=UPI003D6A8BE2